MKRWMSGLLLLVGLWIGSPAAAAEPAAPARVLLLGLFHFDNPGLDAVKYTPIDVLQPAPQRDLEQLAVRLAAFRPTRVLLEYPERKDAQVNARYAAYRAGTGTLERNETDQLGFRVARLAGLSRVHGFDQAAPGGEDALWGYLEQGAPAHYRKLMRLVESMSARVSQEHRTLPLRELLRRCNEPAADRENKGFYLLLNDVGAATGLFHGADASARWWHRNFRMYARIQQHARPGERVLVIAGSGHTAILRDLLSADAERVEEPVLPYF